MEIPNSALEIIQARREQDNAYPLTPETKIVNISTGEVVGTYADHLKRGAVVGKLARQRLLGLYLSTGRGSEIDAAERPIALEVAAAAQEANAENARRDGLSRQQLEAQSYLDALVAERAQEAYKSTIAGIAAARIATSTVVQ